MAQAGAWINQLAASSSSDQPVDVPKFALEYIFLKGYKDKKPTFGFGAVGEFIYQKQYSRTKPNGRKEQWWETIRRVVEGTYNMQIRHLSQAGLPVPMKALQTRAQNMYARMFEMKFLPPGRGLWAMGTKLTDSKHLYAALNNCAFVSTSDMDQDPTEPFCFLMDNSMLGVGVGFDTKGALKKLPVYKPTGLEEIYVVPDTREGWVESLRKLLRSYLTPDQRPVTFDYDQIREAGLPLETFGGVSAGSDPLKALHTQLQTRLGLYADKKKILLERFVGHKIVHTPAHTEWVGGMVTEIPATDSIHGVYWVSSTCIAVGGTTIVGQRENVPSGLLVNPNGNRDEAGLVRAQNVAWSQLLEWVNGFFEEGCAYLDALGSDEDDATKTTDSFQTVLTKEQHVEKERRDSVHRFFRSNSNSRYLQQLHDFFLFSHMSADRLSNGVESYASFLQLCQTLDRQHMDDYPSGEANTLLVYMQTYQPTLLKRMDLFAQHPALTPTETKEVQYDAVVDERLITDIQNLIGVCVVAGNIRRSAEISFGPHDSETFINLKNYDAIENDYRMAFGWSSNNSIFAPVGMDYHNAARHTMLNGEPGFCWLENMQQFSRMCDPVDNRDYRAAGGNPCLEQTLESYELCCLVETFLTRHTNADDFAETLKCAFEYAKTVSLGQTHWARSNAVILRNRRIGCSLSGIVEFLCDTKHGGNWNMGPLVEWFKRGYKTIHDHDTVLSEMFAVRESIKLTSIKPSGTVSLVAGCTPGVHFPEDHYYLRRVRLPKRDPFVQCLLDAGYKLEVADEDKTGNTYVVAFPVAIDPHIRRECEVSMWEKLMLAAIVQRYWADNQVSVTITFDKTTEGPQLEYALSYFQYFLKGVSMLPKNYTTGAKFAYKHAPYETITEKEWLAEAAKIKPIDWSKWINQAKREMGIDDEAQPEMWCTTADCMKG